MLRVPATPSVVPVVDQAPVVGFGIASRFGLTVTVVLPLAGIPFGNVIFAGSPPW
jgi:hypothetical protein